jgi:hypothetical protein
MFIGHYAAGLAAKRLAPTISLGTLFLAVQLADLIWPTLVLLGVEQVEIAPGITAVTPLDFVYYPYSHSLVTLAGWGVLLGAGYFVVRRARLFEGLVLALAVLSHWVLDVVSHRPDMPFGLDGGDRVGLGLWYSRPATLVVELALFALSVMLYARATAPRDRAGRWGFWALVGFLLAVYLANLFGPPPPSVAAVAWAGQALWLLVLWGYWLDRHRQPRPGVAFL